MRRILVLAANPADSSRLRLDKEVREIEEGLRRSRHRDEFQFVTVWAVGPRQLRRALLDHKPEFIHFSGHGTTEGIALENERGATHRVDGDALVKLFSHFTGDLRCVLLNACNSQPQAEAISRFVPYAIGMRDNVSDAAAIEFAVGFYDALGAGKTIEEAFGIACSAIRTFGVPGHSTPVLYRRPGLDDSDSTEGSGPEVRSRAEIAPFFQFLEAALKLGLQSGGRRFAPRIVGVMLYSAVIALLIAALFWLRDPEVLRTAFFALISLALLIFALMALPDLHPYVGNAVAAVVTVCLAAMLAWGAFNIARSSNWRGLPAPGPTVPRLEARGRIRFSDHRPAEGAEVSIPHLRLSDRTNANGVFYLGQIERVSGLDSLDVQIAIADTVFRRRIALNAASLDIVLAYSPRRESPPDTSVSVPPAPKRPESPDSTRIEPDSVREPMREPEPRRRPEPTTGSVVGYVNAAIGGEQYKHYGMTVTGAGACRVRGRVQVLRSGNRDVHIVVLTAEEYEHYAVRRPYSEIFRERNTSDYTLDVELPGPGRYELVISNRTSWMTPKYVLVENVRWECDGGGS